MHSNVIHWLQRATHALEKYKWGQVGTLDWDKTGTMADPHK